MKCFGTFAPATAGDARLHFHPLAATELHEAVGYYESFESGKGLCACLVRGTGHRKSIND